MARSDRVTAALTLSRYKRLILMCKVSLPLEGARRIVGPDCAYHLYFRHADEGAVREGGTHRKRARRPIRGRHK